ncbi:PAS domain-containing protein [Yoonia sp. 208BN28-4]|uniref:PAS domain-containing protein n=1 Tax=Yoonia sp. 208BN28-4 TaxID=3126505 RepID=UPI0030B4D4CA
MTHKIVLPATHTREPFAYDKGEAVLQIVQDYWDALRDNRQIPLRSDLAPTALDYALPHCFIAERVAPEAFRMRVAGQALRDILNMDARGMPISTFLSSDARAAITPMIEKLFLRPRVLEFALQSGRTLARPTTHARLVMLPLRDDQGRTSRVFGALVTDRAIRLGKRRFGLADEPVIQDRVLRGPSGDVRLIATADQPVASETRSSGPGLRLVVDNT